MALVPFPCNYEVSRPSKKYPPIPYAAIILIPVEHLNHFFSYQTICYHLKTNDVLNECRLERFGNSAWLIMVNRTAMRRLRW